MCAAPENITKIQPLTAHAASGAVFATFLLNDRLYYRSSEIRTC